MYWIHRFLITLNRSRLIKLTLVIPSIAKTLEVYFDVVMGLVEHAPAQT